MAEVILMPRLSDTMTEGVIASWHKNVGDKVSKGDLLAEVETDKATMDLESYKDGTLLYIGVEKGKSVAVNALLAIIGNAGENIDELVKGGGASVSADAPVAPAAEAPKAETPAPTAPASANSADITAFEEAILMPRLSDTMTEGVIAAWHKKVGDAVSKGDLLAEVETDKATMDLESYKNGTLLYIGAGKGDKVPVNSLLCIIGNDKTDVNAIVAASKGGAVTPAATDTSVTPAVASGTVATQVASNNGSPVLSEDGRLKVSPLARKLAAEKGVDLAKVAGSGDGGRIIKRDVDNYVPAAVPSAPVVTALPVTATPAASVPHIPAAIGEEGYSDTPNTQMRKVIARRLGESMYSAPHFYLTMELNMDNAIASRAAMNEVSPVKISFNDMLIKACAMALRQHPAVNSSWMGEFIRSYKHIHIGSAVAMPEGLIVPVIRFADQQSLSQIAATAKELYDKAKHKKLQPAEFSGNTFTISNLGMMDIEEFTAIINPPDSCILAVGKIKEVVVKKGDGFGVTNVMKVTLSCDHRSVDGAVGAAFLQTLKKFMENPVTMLV
jgi:pyruvate dehydrogenase E2 component (dihydrolipoamide acetyltransferase)